MNVGVGVMTVNDGGAEGAWVMLISSAVAVVDPEGGLAHTTAMRRVRLRTMRAEQYSATTRRALLDTRPHHNAHYDPVSSIGMLWRATTTRNDASPPGCNCLLQYAISCHDGAFRRRRRFRRSTSVKRNEPMQLDDRPNSNLMFIVSSWIVFRAVQSAVQDHRCYLLSYEGSLLIQLLDGTATADAAMSPPHLQCR